MAHTDCANIDRNREHCPCGEVDCDKHGVCCECIVAHTDNDSFPSCVRELIFGKKE